MYVVAGTDVDRLEHPDYRGDSAFDWGGLTAGSLELAFAMLAHATGSRPPDPICVIFQAEVVACLDRAGFVLGGGDIALWLLTAFCDRDAPDDEPHRTGRIALPAGRATAARRVGCYHRSPGRHL